ncbi:MAG: MobF family relaxase, partial [Gammaproteobacteria bacterium]
MLSSSVIKNVGQAGHYYSEKDNYYTQDEGVDQSEWWGKGANSLSLSGKIDKKQFVELLQGKLPTGEQLGKMENGKPIHRAGWDLTLSAPKSVSTMAYLGGDKRLIDAHREAVKETLSYVERSCSQARVKTSQGMTYQNTNNLVVSLYHHDLSRAKDPQMHTHSIVMNMTQRMDGEWRSLASSMGSYKENTTNKVNGFIERVRHSNRFLSKIYETELAFRVKKLGYEISIDSKTGIFQIADVPQEVIDCFSKRRLQIENQLEEKGLTGGRASAVATLNTRDAKEEVDRNILKAEWEKEARGLGFDFQKSIENSYKRQSETILEMPSQAETKVLHAINQAAKSLSVFQTTFTLEEIMTEASHYAIHHDIPIRSLLSAIESQKESGNLIPLANERGKTLFMAKSTVDDEKRLAEQIHKNKSLQPLIDTFQLSHYLNQHEEINLAYHAHLQTIFSKDRIVLIEGEATKNSLIEPIINILKTADLKMAVLSPSMVGSKQFANTIKPSPPNLFERIKGFFVDSTPKHYSVMQFLSQFSEVQKSNHPIPDVLVVDNAHLLSTHQKANLAEWNTKNDKKLILLGDNTTLLPQQTGNALDELTNHGIKSISIEKLASKAGKTLEKININEAILQCSDRIIEVKDTPNRYELMAKQFCRLSPAERKQSWLVSRNKEAVEQLNLAAHKVLLLNQSLGKGTQTSVLIPVFIDTAKSGHAMSYQANQVIRFNDKFASLGVSKGEYLRVIETNKKSNRVTLQNEQGKKILWSPDRIAGTSGKIELFKEKEREICVGESVIFNRSNKAQNIVKGERFSVTAIKKEKMKLNNADGKSVIIDLAKPYYRHLDYGYAATPHQIAHDKPDFIIADLPAKSFATNQRLFYQTISQPKEAWIYTDNQQHLAISLEAKTGNRLTAQEILQKSDDMKKNLHSLYDILEKQIMIAQKDDKTIHFNRVALEAVEYAMHHLAEREAGFTHKELMYTAMKHALGDVTQRSLTQATIAMEKAGIVLKGMRGDGTLWTTADAVKIEREILAICSQDQGKFQPIASNEMVSHYCSSANLNLEQTAAVKAITQSRNRVMAVQGHAGTGKTTMLTTVSDVLAAKNLLSQQGYEILGLAPTHTAVNELIKRGLPAQTLDSFIANTKFFTGNVSNKSNLILVVDESSMVSNRKMLEGLQITYQLGCRAIKTGDRRQIQSIEAGKPFELIQDSSAAETVKLTNIQRQKDVVLKKAVKETIEYDFKSAFNTLEKSIIETPMDKEKIKEGNFEVVRQENRLDRLKVLVNDYFSFDKSQRSNIQIITPGHDDRRLTNQLIRDGLINEGTLSKENEQKLTILASTNLTQVERSHITNFKVNDVLRFGKKESNEIKSGDYFTISEINQS